MRYLAAALLCSVSTEAFADSKPSPTGKDGHVKMVAYDPSDRTVLVIRAEDVSNITFDPMDTIEHVVKADTAPFGYACEKKSGEEKQDCESAYSNNLQLIGKRPGTASLVVITRAAPPMDKQRPYNFIVKVVADDDPTVTNQLTFTYGAAYRTPVPADPASPRVPTWKEKQAAQQAELAAARLRSDVSYGPQNTKYRAQGRASALAPVRAFDNGALTAFRYPLNMQQPAFFRVIDNHQGLPDVCTGRATSSADLQAPEEAVNTRVVNDLVVVDHTAPHWRVRSGEAVIDLFNCGYDPIGTSTGTGTSSPDVVRRIVAR